MSTAKIGTFDDLLAATEERLRPILHALRQTIRDIHPEACEVVRLGDRAANYGVGPRKMLDGYAYLMPQRAWVNLGFYQGVACPTPSACSTAPARRCATSRSAASTTRAARRCAPSSPPPSPSAGPPSVGDLLRCRQGYVNAAKSAVMIAVIVPTTTAAWMNNAR